MKINRNSQKKKKKYMNVYLYIHPVPYCKMSFFLVIFIALIVIIRQEQIFSFCLFMIENIGKSANNYSYSA